MQLRIMGGHVIQRLAHGSMLARNRGMRETRGAGGGAVNAYAAAGDVGAVLVSGFCGAAVGAAACSAKMRQNARRGTGDQVREHACRGPGDRRESGLAVRIQ